MKWFRPFAPVALLLALALSAHAAVTTLNPTADTDTQSDVAAGTNVDLNVSQYNPALLKFSLSGITGTVSNAKLRLYFLSGVGATTFTVSSTSNDTWTEGGTKPSTGSTITTTAIGASGTGYVEIDLTSHVQTKLAGNQIVSIAVTDTLGSWSSFKSRQSSANKPELVVTTATASTSTLNPTADTDTQSDVAAGTNVDLNVSLYNTALLRFDLSALSGTVSAAKLRLYFSAATAAATYTVASTSTDTWSEGGSKPGAGSTITTKAVSAAAGAGYIEIDLTSHVQTKLSGNKIVSLAVTDSLGSWQTFKSRQSSSNKPELVVTTGGSVGVTRPSYNTGTGFFVLNGKLYDKNGTEFHIRGLNKLHWDWSSPGIVKANPNTVRFDIDFSQSTSTNLNLVNSYISQHIVPMPSSWLGTGSAESALPAIVQTWIDQKSAWQTIDDKFILNIANELGSSNSTAWRDAYITAVANLRNAGYKCPICIDAGGYGQDVEDIATYAQAIYNSDPQKNVIFSIHIYGLWSSNNTSGTIDLSSGLNRLAGTGLCVIVGEFGPGRNVGPSPTLLTPGEIINAADSRNLGWLAWAWDDNPTSGDSWFAMCGISSLDYNSSADLTTFGKDVVENGTYGLKIKAVKQTAY